MGQSKNERMKELVSLLNKASRAYYQEAQEIMSNYEYDRLYDELKELEDELGITLSNSPTVNVGYEVVSELPKERHESPMLSLDKTKEVEELKNFVGDQKVLMSWKMDGLTVVLTYRDGKLYKAVTRGNGEVGEVITNNAKVFKNVPVQIAYQGELILRGEAVIGYKDFEKINQEIEDVDARYKNPRNLCSGSVRQLNNQITAKRNVMFYAFTLVQADGVDFQNSRACQMEWLKSQGFTTVEYYMVTRDTVEDEVAKFSSKISENDFPSDGLVLTYNDIAYGRSLGRTAKFPRDSFAFKWQDEAVDTKLKYIEWSCAVSTISPVAVFEPVQIEGTTVSRASLCNISEIERLGIGKECTLSVIKANKIIPKCIAVKDAVGAPEIPSQCPVCHAPTKVHVSENSGTKTLHCTNPDCTAKNVKKFTRFVSKWGMDIDGLSIQTMLRFMNAGFIHEFADIFRLKEHFGEISQMEGFGEKSVANMEQSIEKSRQVHPVNFIFALCIPLIGVDAGKKIVAAIGFEGFLQRLHQGDGFEDIEGIGAERSRSIVTWYQNEKNHSGFEDLLHELSIEHVEVQDTSSGSCAGLSFVITGDVHHYKNRDEFKAYVESQGGKVTGSVSKKTAYLVNNDVESASSKNRKAKELGIPIISEDTFIEQFGGR